MAPSDHLAYERIGPGYAGTRHPDARIGARIEAALEGASLVLNVGAGTGAYEPVGVQVIAVEPSPTMIDQRPPGGPPVARAVAESLPFADDSVDAAMAVLTVHHWQDQVTGLHELMRVGMGRVVVLTWDEAVSERRFWLLRDYLPELMAAERERCPDPAVVAAALGPCRSAAVPIPADCTDGFFAAFWRRPEAYLDPAVRESISTLAQADQALVDDAMAHLRRDVESGDWARRYATLLDLDEVDLGYRLVVAGS